MLDSGSERRAPAPISVCFTLTSVAALDSIVVAGALSVISGRVVFVESGVLVRPT